MTTRPIKEADQEQLSKLRERRRAAHARQQTHLRRANICGAAYISTRTRSDQRPSCTASHISNCEPYAFVDALLEVHEPSRAVVVSCVMVLNAFGARFVILPLRHTFGLARVLNCLLAVHWLRRFR